MPPVSVRTRPPLGSVFRIRSGPRGSPVVIRRPSPEADLIRRTDPVPSSMAPYLPTLYGAGREPGPSRDMARRMCLGGSCQRRRAGTQRNRVPVSRRRRVTTAGAGPGLPYNSWAYGGREAYARFATRRHSASRAGTSNGWVGGPAVGAPLGCDYDRHTCPERCPSRRRARWTVTSATSSTDSGRTRMIWLNTFSRSKAGSTRYAETVERWPT